MPTFRSRRPRSISQAFASLLSSSPDLTATDRIEVERRAAQANREDALAEKARLEAESERRAAAFREDPRNDAEYAAMVSGSRVPDAEQFRGYVQGKVAPQLVDNDEDGNPLPVADYVRPADLTPEQERLLRSGFAASIANRLGTGKTNAEQFAKSGSTTFADIIRSEIAGTADVPKQNQLKAAINPGYREPYSGTMGQRGTVTNQESGDVRIADKSIYEATLEADRAQGAQRRASAGLAGERATDVRETRPGRMALTEAQTNLANKRETVAGQPRPAPQRTPGQEAIDRARADKFNREVSDRKKADARAKYRADEKMKGTTLGAWVDDRGWEVKKGGKVIGYYD